MRPWLDPRKHPWTEKCLCPVQPDIGAVSAVRNGAAARAAHKSTLVDRPRRAAPGPRARARPTPGKHPGRGDDKGVASLPWPRLGRTGAQSASTVIALMTAKIGRNSKSKDVINNGCQLIIVHADGQRNHEVAVAVRVLLLAPDELWW